jgi:hypothetical protein
MGPDLVVFLKLTKNSSLELSAFEEVKSEAEQFENASDL